MTNPNAFTDGLTKRELFAAMAMQAVLSNSAIGPDNSPRDIAKVAVIEADALIEALNEGEAKP